MLHVFFGTDTTRVRQKAFAFLEKERGSEAATTLTGDTYVLGMILELTQSASLFGGRQCVVLDTLSENSEASEEIVAHAKDMQDSKNLFVVIEGALKAEEKKKWEKCAQKFEELTGEKKERFNAFLMTDAFLRRDKKSLWILLQEAWREGLSNEEIIGVLFWQVKILRLAEKTKSAEEAGQKPFVYQKAKRALSVFKKGELDQISLQLITMYHEGHMGKRDTSLALERWVLTL